MGKSSIPLIIEEALYNKNSKGIKKADIPNRYVNNGYNIFLSFTKDEDQYEIHIDRKTNIKLQLVKNGEDISSHTDTNRKKFLIDLLHLDNYVKLFDLFKDEARKSSTNLPSIESKLATINKWLEDNKLSDTTILPMLEVSFETEDDEKKLRDLTIEIQNISEKNKKIQQNNQYKDLINKINIDEVQKID